jgi:hypothetical protein
MGKMDQSCNQISTTAAPAQEHHKQTQFLQLGLLVTIINDHNNLTSSPSGPIYKEKDKNNVLKDVRSGDTKNSGSNL